VVLGQGEVGAAGVHGPGFVEVCATGVGYFAKVSGGQAGFGCISDGGAAEKAWGFAIQVIVAWFAPGGCSAGTWLSVDGFAGFTFGAGSSAFSATAQEALVGISSLDGGDTEAVDAILLFGATAGAGAGYAGEGILGGDGGALDSYGLVDVGGE